MSLFARYIQERKGRRIVEDGSGFATYQFQEVDGCKGCYIEEIYVIPEKRRNRLASSYADKITEIAKQNGCTKLFGSVCPKVEGAHESMLVLIAYGFKLYSATYDMVYFYKEI